MALTLQSDRRWCSSLICPVLNETDILSINGKTVNLFLGTVNHDMSFYKELIRKFEKAYPLSESVS